MLMSDIFVFVCIIIISEERFEKLNKVHQKFQKRISILNFLLVHMIC